MDTLLNFSGGIDSTYCLYDHLQNNPDKDILVHHLHLYNREGRAPHEWQAVQNILKWFNDRGLRKYKFFETSFDYGTLPNIIFDIEVVAFVSGIALRSKRAKDIKYVVGCTSKDDIAMISTDKWLKKHGRRANILESVSMREVEFTLPIIHLTKKEMMERMPPDLLELCWYCRKPVDGKTCGKCHACNQVEKGLIKHV